MLHGLNFIVRMMFGSHLYGTDTPQSDMDYKAVFIPPARQILLGRVQNNYAEQRVKAEGEKNVAGEMDEEAYSLQKFLRLLSEGQTVSLDMLFAPWPYWKAYNDVWITIQKNRQRLLTRKSAGFIGYCQQQANKYGIKGSRVSAVRGAQEMFWSLMCSKGTTSKVGEHAAVVEAYVAATEHCSIMELQAAHADPGKMIKHFECCGRKVPYTVTVKAAFEIYNRVFEEYGHRARKAETNEGIDWKALSHAVRVGRQALELLGTGIIHFPLAYRDHILEIKRGALPYQQVAEEIEELLLRVEEAAKNSPLPDEVDLKWIDDFVAEQYELAVKLHVEIV